ncbi:MAG: type IX secretion system membrane protein PorP/SprF [Bacteroidales bacterium]
MKRVIFAFILMIVSISLKSQFDAQFSQYWACKNYYNAASVGSDKSGNATLFNRQQWLGMPGAPKSLFIGLDMPITIFGKSQGVGINMFSDNIGLFKNSSVMLNYAYKMHFWGGKISLGAQIGIINQSFDGTKVNIKEFTDPAHAASDEYIPTTSVQAMAYDMGVGVYFSNEKFYAGLSVAHLMQPTLDFDEKSSTYVGRLVYFTSGFAMPIEESAIVLYPSTLIKSDFRVYQFDFTLRGEYNEKFWAGISYRWNNAIIAMVGVRMKNISFGYSYDVSTSKLFTVTSGSHELFATYSFDFALPVKNKTKINKSVRYL